MVTAAMKLKDACSLEEKKKKLSMKYYGEVAGFSDGSDVESE